MLKRTIKYVDYDDVEQEDIFYFNLSKPELVKLEAGEDRVRFSSRMARIVETKDVAVIIEEIKQLILLAYGEKSEDGKRFIKSEESRRAFEQSAAFEALFMELAMDAQASVDFLQGAMPKDIVKEYQKAVAEGVAPDFAKPGLGEGQPTGGI